MDLQNPLQNCKSGFTNVPEKNISILERKQYLNDPLRKKLIIKHRQNNHELKLAFKSFKSSRMMLKQPTFLPSVNQTTPERMSYVKPLL